MVVAILLSITMTFAAQDGPWYQIFRSPEDVPYTSKATLSRQAMLNELMSKYSNKHSSCKNPVDRADDMLSYLPALEDAGLLGGILLNTHRQMETSRSTLPIWSIPNSSLTVEPYAFMKDFEAHIPCNKSGFIKHYGNTIAESQNRKLSRVQVCESWHAYFAAASDKTTSLKESEVQRLLWKAHSHSLYHVWATRKNDFKKALRSGKVSLQEYRLWMSWNRTVSVFLPRSNYNSCAASMWLFLDQAMPNCISGSTVCTSNLVQRPNLHGIIGRMALTPVLETLKSEDVGAAIADIEYEIPVTP